MPDDTGADAGHPSSSLDSASTEILPGTITRVGPQRRARGRYAVESTAAPG